VDQLHVVLCVVCLNIHPVEKLIEPNVPCWVKAGTLVCV
jgi:hypothetical protein